MWKEAFSSGHSKLSKYFSKTELNDCPYYGLAVLIDPRFTRFSKLRRHFDEVYPNFINNAEKMLKKLVNETKEIHRVTVRKKEKKRKFMDFYDSDSDPEDDEVSVFLARGKINSHTDPVEYWKAHRLQYPNLSLVALNILSIPGSAVSCERTFNIGRDMIGLRRHSLHPETMSVLMIGWKNLRSSSTM